MRKLILIFALCFMLHSNVYATAIIGKTNTPQFQQVVRSYFKLPEYLRPYPKTITVLDKYLYNSIGYQVYATASYSRDVIFYKSSIPDSLCYDILLHEIGHISYWADTGRDPYKNSEELANKYVNYSKITQSKNELLAKMGYLIRRR